MKKIMFALLLSLSMSAFGAADPIVPVLKKYNCLMCHAVDKKVVGPSFKDIAVKYKNVPSAEDALVKKVSKGSTGIWGGLAMPANDVKEEHQQDIKRLVQYVLKSAN